VEIIKIPKMDKQEYDSLIEEGYISRIAFRGEKYPYIAPFLYIFDGKFLYFLSTKYGRKNEMFKRSPYVSVQEEDAITKKQIRKKFVDMITEKNLSHNILATLGHDPLDPIEAVATEERSNIWKLTGVADIVALKNL